ncbi:MAG: segregation/condensation protein A [Candidatus Magasanikbacteria bacterium]
MNAISFKSRKFEGPLDLLLSLIEQEKMELSEISLSAVTEQYLIYLDSLEEINPHDLADFLVIAAKLLLLKSKTLLPEIGQPDEEGMSLEEQLRLYRHFVAVSKKLNEMWLSPDKGYERIEPLSPPKELVKPDNLSTDALYESMVQLVSRLAPPKPLPETRIDKTVSLKEKVDILRSLISKRKTLSFNELLADTTSRTEIIISFLALLELVKQKMVYVEQDASFGNIVIKGI